MRGKIISFLMGLLAVYVGYFASLPAPDGLPEPWKMRAFILNKYTMFFMKSFMTTSFYNRISKGVRQDLNSTLNITDTEFDGVRVRIFVTAGEHSEPLPALIFMHGGGWVSESVDTYHSFTNDIATKLDRVLLVSVDYRLAPLNSFPTAINDCTKATVWLLNHTTEYHVDPNRIGIFGDSAGGNLAAAVTQKLSFYPQYAHLPKLKFQALIYPALQAFDFSTPSYQQNGGYQILFLTKHIMTFCWSSYLKGDMQLVEAFSFNNHTSSSAKMSVAKGGILSHDLIPERFKTHETGEYVVPQSNNFGDDEIYDSIKDTLINPDFAPLMRTDLRGLPEAYIATCHFDVLRDDGIIYARRLQDVGVDVTWKHYEVGTHGSMTTNYDGLFALDTGKLIRRDLVAYLNQSLVN